MEDYKHKNFEIKDGVMYITHKETGIVTAVDKDGKKMKNKEEIFDMFYSKSLMEDEVVELVDKIYNSISEEGLSDADIGDVIRRIINAELDDYLEKF